MGDVNRGKPAARPRRTFRKVLVVMLAVAALGAVATAGAVFVAYDQATEIDRAYPAAVAEQFLDATVNQRDSAKAGLFACDEYDADDGLRSLEVYIAELEQKGSAPAQVVVLSSTFDSNQSSVAVEIQIRQSVSGTTSKEVQQWSFKMVDEDGWRVCGASQIPRLSPSPTTQPTRQ